MTEEHGLPDGGTHPTDRGEERSLKDRRREARHRAGTRARRGAPGVPGSSRTDDGTHVATSRHVAGGRKRRRWLRRTLLALVLLVAIAGIGACVTVRNLSKDLPDLGDVNAVATFQTTRIFDAKRRPIASLAGEGNRMVIPDEHVTKLMRQAVVAIEDRRFYSHPAVDALGIARAAWINVVQRSVVQGGSTITQQYVKNAYFTQRRTVERKVREAMLAYRLEKKYTKDQILAKYLNTIYFGEGAYGIEAAAQVYFGKHARQLTLPQAAMLAGIIRSPARYNPFNHAEAARARRKLVLDRMVQEGFVTQEQADAADRIPLPKQKQGALRSGLAPHFIDHVVQRLVALVGEQAAFSGGLKVFTTLDLDWQKVAERAVSAELDKDDDPSASLVAVDPRTGAVRAMVGSRDYRTQQYNMATQGHRQPGSSFKTFVLATGISKGISPDQYFDSDSPATFEVTGAPDWKVSNYEGKGSGHISLTQATVRSVNVAYANLMMQVGADNVVVTARKMGISSQLNRDPAIALGGLRQGVNTLEMASAYGTLANGGVHVPPYTIQRIEDADGDAVPLKRPPKRKALDPAAAHLVTETLEEVIDRGTAVAADIGRPEAGKTGTAQQYTDAWFVGYVPQLSTSVWVGYPDSQRPMKDVHGRRVTGGSFPARIWARFMTEVLKDQKEQDFREPPDGAVVRREIDPITGYLAGDFCPNVVSARYVKGQTPKRTCPVHDELLVPKVVGMDLESAVKELERAGFEATSAVVPSEAPKGRVVIQDPAPQAKSKRGQRVRLSVSDGKGAADATRTVVPAVVDLTVAKAEAALKRAGLKTSVLYRSSSKPRDRVLDQKPAAGTVVARGAKVTLTVSGGASVATVPKVTGLSQDAAQARLESAGFVTVAERASKEESQGKRPGTIVRQSPAAGAEAAPGSTVVIYVAQSP